VGVGVCPDPLLLAPFHQGRGNSFARTQSVCLVNEGSGLLSAAYLRTLAGERCHQSFVDDPTIRLVDGCLQFGLQIIV
jgi:hypothetical protein